MYKFIRNFNWLLVAGTVFIGFSAHAAGLNDTGITTCSNATQNGLPCPVAGSTITPPPSKAKAANVLANITVPFEENRGQADSKVAFQARRLAGPLLML